MRENFLCALFCIFLTSSILLVFFGCSCHSPDVVLFSLCVSHSNLVILLPFCFLVFFSSCDVFLLSCSATYWMYVCLHVGLVVKYCVGVGLKFSVVFLYSSEASCGVSKEATSNWASICCVWTWAHWKICNFSSAGLWLQNFFPVSLQRECFLSF